MARKPRKEVLKKDIGKKLYQSFDFKEESSGAARVLEFMIYLVGFLGALLALPQAYLIWFYGRVEGTLFSWIALATFTPFWIFYAVLNKKFSLAMTYVVWLAATILVIIGIFVRGKL